MDSAERAGDALRLTMEVWHPDCWIIKITEQADVGILGYGIYTKAGGRATTLLTIYADTQATINDALAMIRSSSHVYSVAEMSHNYRLNSIAAPGNATRELLTEHDGTTQISGPFISRGFVYAEPVDVSDGIEHWTVLTNQSRKAVSKLLDDVRDEQAAEIAVTSVARPDWSGQSGVLPLSRLSRRQREVFELARDCGYYAWPKQTSASELAAELEITTQTLHEHLHKVEAKLLGSLND